MHDTQAIENLRKLQLQEKNVELRKEFETMIESIQDRMHEFPDRNSVLQHFQGLREQVGTCVD